jgi:phosphate transport system substrate-binding protein
MFSPSHPFRAFMVVPILAPLALACTQGSEPVKASAETTTTAPADKSDKKAGTGTIDLQGAGATFPFPLYSKWVSEYQKANPKIRINYQSIGSGGGIRQIIEKTVDFGASDAPMTDDELAKVAPAQLVHIPTTLGAVVLAYNLPDVKTGLRLSPKVIAGIFLGDIKTWDHPDILKDNPEVKLPKDNITVAYRSDGSGTTAVFTDYLSKVSAPWKDKVGAGKSVKFPVGLGAKGNEGVAGQIKTSPGTIGYIELAFAKQTGATFGFVKNDAGKFVEPTLDAISAAAAGYVSSMPADFRVSITNAPGDTSYPIASFTYILVYQDSSDAVKAKAVADFLMWAIHDGQKLGPDLFYAPLPAQVVANEETKLKTLTAGGKPLL